MAKGRTGLAAVAVVAAFVACPFAALAQTWSAGPPVPTPRALLGAATVGNMVYAIGGTIPVAANIPTNEVEALDTTTGSWSTKAPLPQPISAPAVVAVDGKVYALGGAPEGGGHPWNTVYVYDPVANSWSTGTPMPTGRVLHSAAVLDGKIYIIGGADPASNFLTAVDVYDPAGDSWSSAAPTPTFRLFGGAASLDGLIYYVGGFNLGPPMDQDIIVYDPGTDSWTARNAKFADTRAGLGLAVLGGALYAVSGQNDFAQVFADVFKYDPVADAWLPGPPIPHARSAFGYAVAGASLYAISGLSSIDVGFLGDSVDVLTLSSDDTAPQTSAAATPAPNAAGWNNSDVTVKLTATDEAGGSGVKFISYKVEGPVSFGGLENDASVTILLSAEGTSTIRFLAGDNAGNFESEKSIVVKIDKTGPGATLALSPGVLWPPNHRMVSITPSLSPSDTGGMPVTLSRIAVSSNESQSAAGDWTVNNAMLQLRAARDGRGSGRVYTVTYTLTDIAGNATEVTATVTVPHDRGR